MKYECIVLFVKPRNSVSSCTWISPSHGKRIYVHSDGNVKNDKKSRIDRIYVLYCGVDEPSKYHGHTRNSAWRIFLLSFSQKCGLLVSTTKHHVSTLCLCGQNCFSFFTMFLYRI